jgi:hypothetical protein
VVLANARVAYYRAPIVLEAAWKEEEDREGEKIYFIGEKKEKNIFSKIGKSGKRMKNL